MSVSHALSKKFEVYVINLDENTSRMSNFSEAFQEKLQGYVRISACRGSTIPRIGEKLLTTRELSSAGRGALGASLSHIAVWERMVADEINHALILEDDAIPLFSAPWTFEDLKIPVDSDVCFVNGRMVKESLRTANPASERKFLPCLDAMMQFAESDNAPGADGYILSAASARKLLTWFYEDGFGSFVDWRLITYCLKPSDVNCLPKNQTARIVLDIIGSRINREDRLKGYVMLPSLTDALLGASDISHENSIG